MRFIDRVDAGRQLTAKLIDLRGEPNLVALGIPRGGVVVGYEVALALGAPFDVTLSHKLGAPENEELAIGALAENGSRILDEALIMHLRVPPEYVARETAQQQREIARRAMLYRGGRKPLEVRDRVVVVIDDGVATGSTMIVTLRALREQRARTLIAATPLVAAEAMSRLRWIADRVVAVHAPDFFTSVGSFYDHFDQVSDTEVRELLADLAATRS